MATTKAGQAKGNFVRTNVVLDDDLVREAMELTGIEKKRGVLDEALRRLVRLRRQAGMRELRGKIEWDGDLAEIRKGRFSDGDR